MRTLSSAAILVASHVATMTASHATSLQVTPVTLEVPAPGAAATLQLTNEGAAPISAQIRVFRWSQQDGVERLEPTDAVVASPPATALTPRAKYTIRVIRLDPTPVAGEEAYRVVVDELPDASRVRNGTISMVLRYSVPLFFTAPAAAAPRISWLAGKQNKHLAITATNAGERRLRISALKVNGQGGASVSFGDGLTGYVLGRSSMRFVAKTQTNGFGSGSVTIKADSDLGRVDAVAPIRK